MAVRFATGFGERQSLAVYSVHVWAEARRAVARVHLLLSSWDGVEGTSTRAASPSRPIADRSACRLRRKRGGIT